MAAPQQQRGLLGGFLGPDGRDARARLAIALEGLTMNPNQALVGELQRGIQSRETAAQKNATVEWLRSRGRDDLAAAIEGGLPAADALRLAMQPADPMAAINLEKAQIELQRLKTGADMDPNVQSSAPLPDQSGVVLTMRDGTIQVRTVGGQVVTGQAAMDFVRTAQENAAEYQRSIYSARREGTLGADIGLGEEAAAAGARGTVIGQAQGAAVTGEGGAVQKAQNAIDLIDQIKKDPALPQITGMIQGNLPPMTQAGTDLEVKIRQLQGQAFLEAFESLKGGGAITEREGQAATEAMARLSRSQSLEAYQQALTELQGILRMGQERARTNAARARGENGAAPPAGGNRIRYDDNGNRIE
jgi:hypothetical protein